MNPYNLQLASYTFLSLLQMFVNFSLSNACTQYEDPIQKFNVHHYVCHKKFR